MLCWEHGVTSFCLGRDLWVSVSPGCFSYATLTAEPCSPTLPSLCYLFASSQDRFLCDHFCLRASLKPPDPPRQLNLTSKITFLPTGLCQPSNLASLSDPACLCWDVGLMAPISGLTSPIPMITLLPAPGTSLLILSLVPMVGAVKKELLGKMPLASLSP